MKFSIHNYIKTGMVGIVILSMLSCKKYLTVDAPNNKLETASVFADSTSASSAIVGIYSPITASNTSFVAYIRVASLCSDELDNNPARTGDFVEFRNNDISPANATLNTLWSGFYKSVYQANAVIEGVTASNNISASAKKTLIGEAKLMRAFCFYYLVNLWGDVPLTTTTDYRINGSLGRTPSAEVYTQIINDLTEAETSLPIVYPTTERVRPNKWAAAALLARVYLYTKNWQMAETESNKVINSGLYNPLPAVANTFVKTSPETIWQLYPAVSALYNTFDGNSFVPSGTATVPNGLITADLYNSMENIDLRKTSWIGTQTVLGVPYRYPYKYKIRSGTPALTEYTIVCRLAEQYLIRAEARAQLGANLSGSANDLNVIRSRAGLLNTTATTTATLLPAIYQERRAELFTEWGTRWFDLKRTGLANTVLKAQKPATWVDTDVLWPIPNPQLLSNPALVQNSGYN